jgi:hypothetical protein
VVVTRTEYERKRERMETSRWYTSINEIRIEAKRAGSHFFDADTMRFFGSRVLPTVYGGRYFITSEQDNYGNGARAYTVRIALDKGNVDTVGAFQAYATRAQAVKAIKRLLTEGGNK